ncbi:conserved exported hypothetical protein [Microbacterium sp. 8M]|uniref:hypothetical protein n=1 Tax=Microbacterium sp. 8M TaxID=2653153 RepID=UPI0012F0A0CF|nr:hypothetical protein [Microbacterium sp. 8M]VXB78231.1 conserved exported hypothetical protein [Microbacterium sp. 8M]
MSTQLATSRRLLRRELRASRTAPAAVVAIALLTAIVATAAVCLWTTGDPRVGAAVGDAVAFARSAWEEPAVRAAAALAAAVVGLILLGLALVPGRRARHGRAAGRVELIVDDGLLADSAAHAVAERCALPPSQVSVTVTARRARVRIRPISGVPVDESAAAGAARRELERLGFALRPIVTVSSKGVLA